MSPHRPDTRERHDRGIARALAAMHARLDDPLTLPELARTAAMSPYHFLRVFREVTGLTPGHFLSALRLATSKYLLRSTDLTITAICFEVGFSSPGTFSNRFREAVGTTPGHYRSLHQRGPRDLGLLVRQVLEGFSSTPLFRPGAEVQGAPRAEKGTAGEAALLSFRGSERASEREGEAEGVCGLLRSSDPERGPTFVGLFPGAIAEGRPLSCTMVDRGDGFQVGRVPDGRYHLMAVSLRHRDPAGTSRSELSGSSASCSGLSNGVGGAARVPVCVRQGRLEEPLLVELRNPEETDPPILLSIPFFLHRLARRSSLPPH